MTIYSKRGATRLFHKIYIQHYGPVPREPNGRKYEIHHLDGDHSNNDPANLKAVTLQEHYDLHFARGDYGACNLLSKKLKMSSHEISALAKLAVQQQIENGNHNWSKKGAENCNYDHTIYKFENIHSGQIIETTQYEFRTKFGYLQGNVGSFVRGVKKTCGGWILHGSQTPSQYLMHGFINTLTGEVVHMTQDNFVKKYNLNRSHVCQMIKKNKKCQSVKGWKLYSS